MYLLTLNYSPLINITRDENINTEQRYVNKMMLETKLVAAIHKRAVTPEMALEGRNAEELG